MKEKDKTMNALERVVNQAISNGETAKAYLCRLQLPKQFSDNTKQANDIYKKVQSDFCKTVMRKTGDTPRYITVRTENSDNPEYAFCLFTKNDASLDKPEYEEKGREIANGKVGQAGWGRGKLDILELMRDAPRFTISPKPITITASNKASAMETLHEHLKEQGRNRRVASPHSFREQVPMTEYPAVSSRRCWIYAPFIASCGGVGSASSPVPGCSPSS